MRPRSIQPAHSSVSTRRRWIRVVAWSVVLLIATVGGPLGLLIRSATAQHRAVRALRERGGQVTYRGHEPAGAEVAPIDDAGLFFNLWAEVSTVDLGGTEAGDREMAYLEALPMIEVLVLRDTHVTDAGLEFLTPLALLSYLDLHGTDISDAGLEAISQLSQLEDLDLSQTAIGDSQLADLANLRRLRSLDLTQTRVSDVGLPRLARLKSLQWLGLGQTGATAAAIARLRSTKPRMAVSLEGGELKLPVPHGPLLAR